MELPEKLHVTLAFLGSVASERVDELRTALRATAGTIAAFSVRLDAIGAFPDERRAQVVWAGSHRNEPEFVGLAERVREVARGFATLDEKPPVLHVTLARLREPGPLPKVQLQPRTVRVDAVVLYESLPGEKTTRYEVVERFPLTVQASSPAGSR